jgi:DNA-directed RNA polymerase specialized sigma subunit
MREITYRDLLVNDLQKMRSWEFAVDQMTEELRTLDEEYATIKATDYDKMPRGSGENIQEEKIITAISKRDQKRHELELTMLRLADMSRLLDQLNDEERWIIQKTVIERKSFDIVSQELHCDISTISRKRNAALNKLCQLRHGAVYQP